MTKESLWLHITVSASLDYFIFLCFDVMSLHFQNRSSICYFTIADQLVYKQFPFISIGLLYPQFMESLGRCREAIKENMVNAYRRLLNQRLFVHLYLGVVLLLGHVFIVNCYTMQSGSMLMQDCGLVTFISLCGSGNFSECSKGPTSRLLTLSVPVTNLLLGLYY